jgi:hypothetical protein
MKSSDEEEPGEERCGEREREGGMMRRSGFECVDGGWWVAYY